MNSFLGQNRLRITDYFSELKATVNALVETYIVENQHDQAAVDKLNKARKGWFKEADECEASDLAEFEKREDRDLELEEEKLLKRFCFSFEFQGDVLETGCFTWRFVSTDIYMSPGQIACFQVMIKYLVCDDCNYEQVPPPGPESLSSLFKSVKSNLYNNWVPGKEYSHEFQVKNLNLSASSLRHNLHLIQITGEKLLAFNEAVLFVTINGGFQDEAAFLFSQLTHLRIRETFKNCEQFKQLKFIELESPSRSCFDLEKIGRKTFAQIKSMSLDQIKICNRRPDLLNHEHDFVCAGEHDADGGILPGTTPWIALTHLDLNWCEIDIDAQGFADLFPLLENLCITFRNCYNSLEPLVIFESHYPFRTMRNIRVVKLENVSMKSFAILDGDHVPNLDELNIQLDSSMDSLTHINSFPDFPKLTKLELRLFHVKWIHPKAFDHLTQLTHFKIHCTELVKDTFETGVAAPFMSFHIECKVLKLTSKFISKCVEINLINENEKMSILETPVALSGLERLTTSNWVDADLPFKQMTNLEYVSLDASDLSIIGSGQLRCLSKLRVLKLKNTYMKTLFDLSSVKTAFKLNAESLSGLPSSLTQLSIAGLKYMTSIEPNAFQHLPCLEKLSLENNSIDQIEPAAFNNLNKLMRLELRGNKLTNFRFAELPASAEPYCLKVLDLSCNQLIFIPKRSVTNLPTSLVNLNLGENFIEAIESGAFKDLVNLRSLNLAEMLCETLNVDDILNRDTANLRYLDIRGANANMKILCHDSSHQNAEGASVNEKRTQSEGVLKFPVKNLRNRLVVYANHSRIQPIEGVLQVVVDYEEID